MLYDKRHSIENKAILALKDLKRRDIFNALRVVESIEQTAYHAGAIDVKYLAPKIEFLILCNLHEEAIILLNQVRVMAAGSTRRPTTKGRCY